MDDLWSHLEGLRPLVELLPDDAKGVEAHEPHSIVSASHQDLSCSGQLIATIDCYQTACADRLASISASRSPSEIAHGCSRRGHRVSYRHYGV